MHSAIHFFTPRLVMCATPSTSPDTKHLFLGCPFAKLTFGTIPVDGALQSTIYSLVVGYQVSSIRHGCISWLEPCLGHVWAVDTGQSCRKPRPRYLLSTHSFPRYPNYPGPRCQLESSSLNFTQSFLVYDSLHFICWVYISIMAFSLHLS